MITKTLAFILVCSAAAQRSPDPFLATPENRIRYSAFGEVSSHGNSKSFAIRIEDLGSRGNPVYHDPRYTNVWRILLVSDTPHSLRPVPATWADITSENWDDGRSAVVLPGFGTVVWRSIDPQLRSKSFVTETYWQKYTVFQMDRYTTEILIEDPAK